MSIDGIDGHAAVQRVAKQRRGEAWAWVAVALLLALLSAAVLWLSAENSQTSNKVESQAEAIDKQAEDDKRDATVVATLELQLKSLSGSVDPADRTRLEQIERTLSALESSSSPTLLIPGPQGVRGFQGIPGLASTIPGPQGDSGIQGLPGRTGADSTVAGPQGPAGADSTVPGPTGADGPAGPTGADGPAGPAGAPGASAFPFTFTITVPGEDHDDLTYTCTVTAADSPGTCTT